MSLKINDERPVIVRTNTSGGPTAEQVLAAVASYTGVAENQVIVIKPMFLYAVRLGADWTPPEAAMSTSYITIFFADGSAFDGSDLPGTPIPTSLITALKVIIDVL